MATSEDEVEEQVADLVATHGPFMLTKTSARATRDATFEEWEAATKWAQDVEKASPFWIGDLLAYGEHKYGEMYSQMMDATSSYGTLANAAYVAGRVESSRRRENLPFSHHQEVAPLPPAEQDAWLDKCATDGLTREQLRHRIKAARAEAAGTTVEYGVAVTCLDADDQQQLADRLRLEGRSVKMTVVKM